MLFPIFRYASLALIFSVNKHGSISIDVASLSDPLIKRFKYCHLFRRGLNRRDRLLKNVKNSTHMVILFQLDVDLYNAVSIFNGFFC